MENQVQLFINVDNEGNIKSVYSGENIIAYEKWHYWFLVLPEVAENAHLYKVVINEMVPDIVLKESV